MRTVGRNTSHEHGRCCSLCPVLAAMKGNHRRGGEDPALLGQLWPDYHTSPCGTLFWAWSCPALYGTSPSAGSLSSDSALEMSKAPHWHPTRCCLQELPKALSRKASGSLQDTLRLRHGFVLQMNCALCHQLLLLVFIMAAKEDFTCHCASAVRSHLVNSKPGLEVSPSVPRCDKLVGIGHSGVQP